MGAAFALIGEGKLTEGIDRLLARVKNNSSGRERLRWRLALSRVLMDAEQTVYALPQLEQAVTDIDNYRLEAYEPAMALEGLKLAWQGFRSQSEPHFKEKAMDVLYHIGRIDLTEMVRLSQI
jgi:type VI secretion system protein VasJ